ncbi:HWE histidine kinase domain-containing protein, partial [Propionivibrio sp.]|uniref:HWE histidine kinase domain-containing protein n=1 Tax=Propionivibrio sp. TaxID=2212460 RepID=UPI003BF310AB
IGTSTLANVRHYQLGALILGVEPERLLQLPLSSLFEDQVLVSLVEHLRLPEPSVLLGLNSRSCPRRLDATVHAQGRIGIIELEAAGPSAALSGDPLARIKSMLAVLQAAEGFEACYRSVAAQVRAATGYDRVMVYRFLHDGSGKIVAEDKADELASFLDLHYPASDIPTQARELYRRNWLRLIPDVNYTPVPLQSCPTERIGQPLDMSHCTLRSVSPIHVEYLQNMGVSATMTLSIVTGNTLWGLIACHNNSPLHIASDLRVACELFARIFSLYLEVRIETDVAQRRLAPRRVYAALANRLPQAMDFAVELVSGTVTILDLIPAGGAAVCLDGKLHTLGQTPPPEVIGELVAWLNGLGQPVVDTFQLGAIFPPSIPFASMASGLLAIALSRQPADYVMWFRPEVVRTVTWAGDPHKPLKLGAHGERLTPRKSFEAWQEEVRLQSSPWDAVDLEAALAFRVWLLENVLQQMDLARQEREAAFEQQNLLMAELDHRVKNTLANIQALVRQTKSGAESLDDFALSLEQRIRAMAHAHDLMGASRWKGASVRKLVEEELAPYRAGKNGNLRISGDDLLLSPKAAMPFTLVVHELTTNAAKYGALSTPSGSIDIGWCQAAGDGELVVTWKERNGPPVAPPIRRGFGSVVIERSLRHEVNGTCILKFDTEGVSCVITIPAEHLLLDDRKAEHV